MDRIQIIATVGSGLYLGVIFWLVEKSRLREAYAILWFAVGVLMLVVSLVPKVMDAMAALLGIYTPVSMLFLIMMMGMLLILLQFSLVVSKQSDRLLRLTQEIALLKEKLARLTSARHKRKRPAGTRGASKEVL